MTRRNSLDMSLLRAQYVGFLYPGTSFDLHGCLKTFDLLSTTTDLSFDVPGSTHLTKCVWAGLLLGLARAQYGPSPWAHDLGRSGATHTWEGTISRNRIFKIRLIPWMIPLNPDF